MRQLPISNYQFPMSQIEEIKNRIDIVDLVGSYLRLQKAGANFKAVCPFHREKTPSFNVSPARQIWHCFGCGKGGDAFEFIKEIESVEFYDALKILAERTGVELINENSGEKNERSRLLALLEDAAKFFESNLVVGQPSSAYLQFRGLAEDTIKEFRIGYASQEWKGLFNHLLAKGYKADEIERAGLVVRSQNSKIASQNYYDRFRGRIIFPIFDYSGRVVAFGGRIYPEKENEAKYVNSPETPLYQKSKILYGLNKSKNEILKDSKCVVVEGYVDMIMSWQSVVQNVVASSGTALTEDQLKILRRLGDRLIIAFDMDKAGEEAARRGISLALAEGFEVKVVAELKNFKDPADAALSDPETWKRAVKNSRHIAQFYIDSALKKFQASTPEAKREFQKSVIPIIAILPELEQAHWIKEIANILSIKEEAVWAAIAKREIANSKMRKEGGVEKFDAKAKIEEPSTRKALLEGKILSIVSQYPILGSKVDGPILPVLKKEANAAVFAELFLSGVSEAEIELANCQRELKKEYLKERLSDLEMHIREAEKSGIEANDLVLEFQKISSEFYKI